MNWQPIETAPKDGTWILLAGGDDQCNYCAPAVVAHWRGDEWMYAYWDGDWRSEYQSPTHWQPLPEPPA